MSLIQDYHTKPPTEPLFEGKKTFSANYFGVEIELEAPAGSTPEECAAKVNEVLGDFVVLKQDNTLINGLEICTRPASLEYHKEKWKGFFENLRGYITTFGVDKVGITK